MRAGGKKTLKKKPLDLFPEKLYAGDKKHFASISEKINEGNEINQNRSFFEKVNDHHKHFRFCSESRENGTPEFIYD